MSDSATADNGLPEGWQVTRLGDLVAPSKEKAEPAECPATPYLSLEHIESGTARILGRGVGSDVSSTKSVFDPLARELSVILFDPQTGTRLAP